MAGIRRIVHEVWDAERLEELPLDQRINLALMQFQQDYAEDKLAGVLMLSERLLGELQTEHVGLLARPFDHIDDWSTCDWYCVKGLGACVAAA